MNQKSSAPDYLWIASEICYYLGLVGAALILPTLVLVLWLMSLVDKANPNYWYLLIAWGISVLTFVVGIGLKNWHYSIRE